MKAAVVNGQFAPVIPCKGQHIPCGERLSLFLRQHLSGYRMHRIAKHASRDSASLVTFLSIAFVSLALVFSTQASAQDPGNGAAPQPANPPASAESSAASQSAPSQGKDVPPAQPGITQPYLQSYPEWVSKVGEASVQISEIPSWGMQAESVQNSQTTGLRASCRLLPLGGKTC